MPTDHPLSSQALKTLRRIEDLQLQVIAEGMRHQIAEHNQPSLVLALNLCKDSVMVICGQAAYQKLLSLHEQHQEVKAGDETDALLKRAAG